MGGVKPGKEELNQIKVPSLSTPATLEHLGFMINTSTGAAGAISRGSPCFISFQFLKGIF